jgi:hypothetical protein
MTKRITDETDVEEQPVDEMAVRIEALEAFGAEAEARHEAVAARAAALESELAEARAAAATEAAELRAQLEASRARAREAAVKYREARLASAPEVPAELVPESDDIAETEERFEAARRLVSEVQERLRAEAEAQARQARVPAGSPVRRAPDLSSLSAAEKIRMGLEARERDGR